MHKIIFAILAVILILSPLVYIKYIKPLNNKSNIEYTKNEMNSKNEMNAGYSLKTNSTQSSVQNSTQDEKILEIEKELDTIDNELKMDELEDLE